uniref:Uncharacterized protein n=1 Tax=Anguilla anguilla TaxID=7936 RepID=A0A0E9SII0_ANGAN
MRVPGSAHGLDYWIWFRMNAG